MSVTVTFNGTITGPTASNLNSAGYTYTPGNPWFYSGTILVDKGWPIEYVYADAYFILASKASPTYKYLFQDTDDDSNLNYIRNLYNNVTEGLPYSGPKIAVTKTGNDYHFFSRGTDGEIKDVLAGEKEPTDEDYRNLMLLIFSILVMGYIIVINLEFLIINSFVIFSLIVFIFSPRIIILYFID